MSVIVLATTAIVTAKNRVTDAATEEKSDPLKAPQLRRQFDSSGAGQEAEAQPCVAQTNRRSDSDEYNDPGQASANQPSGHPVTELMRRNHDVWDGDHGKATRWTALDRDNDAERPPDESYRDSHIRVRGR